MLLIHSIYLGNKEVAFESTKICAILAREGGCEVYIDGQEMPFHINGTFDELVKEWKMYDDAS